MKNFFETCKTLDELKAAYRAAVKKHHPDRGGDTATMQRVNADYSVKFEELKAHHNATHDADHQTTETPDEYKNIIEELLKLDGLEVELCGCWLWISGDTMKHKDRLKAIGCKWCSKKKCWSWHHAEDGRSYYRGKRSMNDIRTKYGSQSFSAGRESNFEAIPA